MSLIVELLPNAPNLILLDAERRVLSSFLPVTPQHGIAEYEPYSYPKSGDKIDLQRIVDGEVPELAEVDSAADPKAWLVSHVAGIGPVFAAELVQRQKKSERSMTSEIRELLEEVRTTSRGAWLYSGSAVGAHSRHQRYAAIAQSHFESDRFGLGRSRPQYSDVFQHPRRRAGLF